MLKLKVLCTLGWRWEETSSKAASPRSSCGPKPSSSYLSDAGVCCDSTVELKKRSFSSFLLLLPLPLPSLFIDAWALRSCSHLSPSRFISIQWCRLLFFFFSYISGPPSLISGWWTQRRNKRQFTDEESRQNEGENKEPDVVVFVVVTVVLPPLKKIWLVTCEIISLNDFLVWIYILRTANDIETTQYKGKEREYAARWLQPTTCTIESEQLKVPEIINSPTTLSKIWF